MAIIERPGGFGVRIWNSGRHKWIGTYRTLEEAQEVEAAVRVGLPIPVSDPLADCRYEGEPVVYFISAPELGLVKIGFSASLRTRFSDLASASPVELRLLHVEQGGSVDLEREMHRRFWLYRVRGEWFRIAGDLAEYLDSSFDNPKLRLIEREMRVEGWGSSWAS